MSLDLNIGVGMKITLEVPEAHVLSDPSELGRRVLLYAALLMFRSGELSAGAAAEFAGVDRFTFASECQRHGISLIDYRPGELRSEVESLRRVL
jgi:predicted HTH domain antitoxin